MPDGPVIANNTPLVALWVLGRLDLLRGLYDEVLDSSPISRSLAPEMGLFALPPANHKSIVI
jgi:predicted nucleic acid-binding protein